MTGQVIFNSEKVRMPETEGCPSFPPGKETHRLMKGDTPF